MILNLLSIVNFKNYQNIQIELSDSVNCFLGDNGVGKTNLLDAIYYLSFCKSYFNTSDFDSMRYGNDYFMIRGDFKNDNENLFQVNFGFKNKRKTLKFNKKKYQKLSDHIGKIPLVIITPMDSNLIVGRSDLRRKFFDILLSQLYPNYLTNLVQYNRVLRQRNAMLKKSNINSGYLDLISTYDNKLSVLGHDICTMRLNIISLIIDSVQNYYSIISEQREIIDIEYNSQLLDADFSELLKNNIHKDKILKFTTVGIHRDDFNFKLNNYSLKNSGSQGQQKSFIIALKFAYYDILKSILKLNPILLLDDIFDKLDNNRLEKIIRILNQNKFGQIFITDTNYDRINKIMHKVDNNCKYFLFNQFGEYEEKFKE
tara:strand:+ start:1 stop:1113 length:1113 start_codon:yes stop_codon:yes gene_type:complete